MIDWRLMAEFGLGAAFSTMIWWGLWIRWKLAHEKNIKVHQGNLSQPYFVPVQAESRNEDGT